jgi:hypothetical protein
MMKAIEKAKAVRACRGLPLDCPGCLRRDAMRRKTWARWPNLVKLTCRGCGVEFHMYEREK